MRKLPLNPSHERALSVVLFLALMVVSRPSFAAKGALVANPTSVAFGNVPVGTSQSQSATLTNTNSSGITLYQSSVSGTGFSATGLSLPMTLSAGQSVTFTLTFTPTSSGSTTGSFSVTTKYWHANVSIPLSGTGTVSAGQLSVAPGSLSFGNVTVGGASSLSSSLSASSGSVTVSSVTTTNSQFYLNGLTLPATIAAGQTVPFTVTFAPQSSGTTSATLGFLSTSTTATSQTLAGTGVTTVSHSVTLGWSDSSSGVSGYNVYRGSTSGGPYARINATVDPSTNYVDSSVSSGQTYYYVTTAVGTNGVESAYSSQVQAVIPSP